MATASKLRAVAPDETAPSKTVSDAARVGSQRDLLVAMRTRIAKAVDDPKCPPRDLAALTRRLHDLARDIEEIDSRNGGDDIGSAASTPDEAFDPEAL